MKTRIKIASIIAGMLLVSSGVFAQHIQTQYFLNIPQKAQLNPAYRPDANVFIGVPVLSGTYFGMSNNLLNMGKLIQPMPGTDSIMTITHPDFDRDKFYRSIGNKGFISTEVHTPVIGVGFSVADVWWVDLGMSVKGMQMGILPADLFKLVLEGNEDFIGSFVDLSGAGLRIQAYLETHVGLSRNITNKLRVGGRLKFIQGALSASMIADKFELQVHEDYSQSLVADISMKLNGPWDITLNPEEYVEDLLFQFSEVGPSFKNFGLGLDLGAEYMLMDNLQLSASIIDLGFISWKKDTYTYTNANKDFTFDGFDISEVITGDKEFDEIVDEFGDSLLTAFDFIESEDGYTTGLPAKLYLSASYQPVDFLSLGALSRTTVGMGVRESLTLSATLFAGNVLSTSLSYTMTNRSFNNFGFGLGVRGGPVQFYAVVDQIPASWIEFVGDGGDDRVVVPQRLDYINMRFGFNLLFGRYQTKKRADTPMLVE